MARRLVEAGHKLTSSPA
ncbi:hypothetical protein AB0M44_15315 [Streptosporangium subroseum]